MNLVQMIHERLVQRNKDLANYGGDSLPDACERVQIESEIQFLTQLLPLVAEQPEWEDLTDQCLFVMAPELQIFEIRFADAKPDPRNELMEKLKARLKQRKMGACP